MSDAIEWIHIQIMALEDEVKTIPALKKAMEQYKDKVMEIEREKYKALEGLQVRKEGKGG